ncbi:MAG TPA: glycosyltransferase family 4 protein [Patescibacteria group bacterium]|nr:glycosyltransferase family 4 protein [Patescibacteria group bacterium]
MNILQLTPGAGTMYCGNCLRDNALVAALRDMGHDVLMVPLYLPLTLDETDQSAGTPVFFSGINVYLDQQSTWFRNAPRWLRHLLSSTMLLKWAARFSAKTRAETLGPLTLSMLHGENGNQAAELNDLISWLKTQPAPDLIFLSNALLLGMGKRLKQALNRPLVCMLQGEDYFLDSLPEGHRQACWETLAKRAVDADLFIAPSRYFGQLMQTRLAVGAERVRVVYNGISLEGYENTSENSGRASGASASPPVLGYLARMCREKGLHTLVRSFIELRKKAQVPQLKLCVAGSLGPNDEPLVRELRRELDQAGLGQDASFHPNIDRATKLSLLQSFTVFSVPALYGEAFGLYVIEALAAGVPVVQPATAAFPELIELTGGGILCEPGNSSALAEAIETLLLDTRKARQLGVSGRRAVFEQFTAEAMAQHLLEAVKNLECCAAR